MGAGGASTGLLENDDDDDDNDDDDDDDGGDLEFRFSMVGSLTRHTCDDGAAIGSRGLANDPFLR